MVAQTWRMNSEPINPAPPVTRIVIVSPQRKGIAGYPAPVVFSIDVDRLSWYYCSVVVMTSRRGDDRPKKKGGCRIL